MKHIEKALYDRLIGNAALVAELGGIFVHNEEPPPGTALPYVVFSHYAEVDTNETPLDAEDYLYLVKGVAATIDQAGDLDLLIKAALDAKLTLAGGWLTNWISRTRGIKLLEHTEGGGKICHRGGIYSIRISK